MIAMEAPKTVTAPTLTKEEARARYERRIERDRKDVARGKGKRAKAARKRNRGR